MDKFIITIDGPAGSGKSTIAKLLAKKNGFVHINSGAIYRALAYVLDKNVDREKLANLNLELSLKGNSIKVFCDGEDITDRLQSETIGRVASKIAQIGFVRDYVNKKVRDLAETGKFVIDGRDCGTVIFPYADVKIFLVADLKERARRRAFETGENFDEVLRIIEKRDKEDSERDIAPLIKPDDAYEVDTTGKSIEDVYNEIMGINRRVYDNRNS